MLEGLEAVEMKLSEVNIDNLAFRFDSEFFKKEFIYITKLINRNKYKRLQDIEYTILHPAEITREYTDTGIWFFRAQNVRPLEINQNNKVYISKNDAERLKNNIINKNDILITRSGANFGQTALYDLDEQAIASSHTLILRNTYFNQLFLSVFLNTTYAKQLIIKGMYGGSQPEIAPYYLSTIPIPDVTFDFQLKIEELVKTAHTTLEQSKQLYKEAEDILLQELGLKDWKPTTNNIATKSFADFMVSGRLDAEYYQPKYDELFAHLKEYDTRTISEIASIKKSIEPGSDAYQDTGIPFVRVSNLTKFGLSEPDIHLDKAVYNIQELKPKKDTILLSKDGSVGVSYKLENDLEAITSGAILHLNITDKDFLPDYVTLVLNSILVKMQAERDAGGSIIQHWKPTEIEQVIIPKLSTQIQTAIAEKIQESFALKSESKRLLELAKTAVETAIEQGEEQALSLLNTNPIPKDK